MSDEQEVLTITKYLQTLFDEHPDDKFSRGKLARKCGARDRVIREALAELRTQGHLIVADEEGGYRLATSSPDVLRYTASLRSRIIKLARVVRAMEQEAARQFGDFEQLPLDLAG